jgi:hypothetical protein
MRPLDGRQIEWQGLPVGVLAPHDLLKAVQQDALDARPCAKPCKEEMAIALSSRTKPSLSTSTAAIAAFSFSRRLRSSSAPKALISSSVALSIAIAPTIT